MSIAAYQGVCPTCRYDHSADTLAPTTRETADHAELARECIRGLQSIEDRVCEGDPFRFTGGTIYFKSIKVISALLSEIAALRGELAKTERDYSELRDSFDAVSSKLCVERAHGSRQSVRATQAERQRDELRKAMPDISSVIAWLDNGCEPKHAVTELSIYKARIDQALANQGADQ